MVEVRGNTTFSRGHLGNFGVTSLKNMNILGPNKFLSSDSS